MRHCPSLLVFITDQYLAKWLPSSQSYTLIIEAENEVEFLIIISETRHLIHLEIFEASNCNYLHDSLNMLFDLVLHNTNNEIEIITSTFNCSGLNEAAAIRDSRCTIDII